MTDKEIIKAEIGKRIEACKTKNGFPAGRICAIRIETYEELLSCIDSMPRDAAADVKIINTPDTREYYGG
jgi:hypothetical protein